MLIQNWADRSTAMAQPTPKLRAITISQSFIQSLPTLPRVVGLAPLAYISGQEALDADPPKLWLRRTIQPYVNLANTALTDPNVHRECTENCTPSIERTFMVSAEGDVVRAAALYFLYPANVALTAMYPDVEIHCQAESSSGGTRPDIIYKRRGQVFAMVEYKNLGVVHQSEFTEARLPITASREEIEKKVKAAQCLTGQTCFGSNAIKVLKQMTAYVNNPQWNAANLKYVAMFNWDLLFLSVFGCDADVILGTLVSRAGPERNQLRKAYLGWLLVACNNAGGSGSG